MNVSVIGCGRLGAPYAAAMAQMGNQVLGLDAAPALISTLLAGRAPFNETGLEEAIAAQTSDGSLAFTTSYADVAAFADVHFLCVGTPQSEDSLAADLTDLKAAIIGLARSLTRNAIIVIKSSVPAGATARMADLARSVTRDGVEVAVSHSPDFLRESTSLADLHKPTRIVLGVAEDDERSEAVLREVWAAQLASGAEMIVTDLVTAELAKVACNTLLATKLSFANGLAALCEQTGGDALALARAVTSDPRIGASSFHAGIGWGGSCWPKDLRSLAHMAETAGLHSLYALLESADRINTESQDRMVEVIREAVGGSLTGQRIGVWGLTFKPGVDDLRDSPALNVAMALNRAGAEVIAYDPGTRSPASPAYLELRYAKTAADALRGVRALAILTDWREFTRADPAALVELPDMPIVVDGRMCLSRHAWTRAGWEVIPFGYAA
jgi:UDPglucose 6-dehydrogenase